MVIWDPNVGFQLIMANIYILGSKITIANIKIILGSQITMANIYTT
jgi:hypothetical protein